MHNSSDAHSFHILGWFHFARRYYGNPSWFLFLRLIICLNSAGNLAWFRIKELDWRNSNDIAKVNITERKHILNNSHWQLITSSEKLETPYRLNRLEKCGKSKWYRNKHTHRQAISTNAFRNLVVHECTQVTLHIAVCCVLPRYESRVIHR